MTAADLVVGSPQAMQALAQRLAAGLQGGEQLALVGELGAGKTTFVQGLAVGLGVGEQVSSPTFVIVKQYHGARLPLVHADFYRLADAAEGSELALGEDLPQAVVVAEWPERVAGFAEASDLVIRLAVAAEGRRVQFEPLTPRGAALLEALR